MANLRKKFSVLVVGAAALSLTLTACGGGGDSGSGGGGGGSGDDAIDTSNVSGEIDYWLWESAQQPAYQKCADKFQAANPNTKIKIGQFAWDDYWNKLNNAFVAGDAPDVFTDHLAKYPEYITNEQLVPLDATLKKDGFNVDQYQPGLADLWVGSDGKRYGLPKDFDTTAVFYNKKLVKDAGISEDQLKAMTWNPKDTGSNGWTFTDKNPWGTHYNYDQPQFQETIGWVRTLIDKGYMPSIPAVTGQSSSDIFAAGKYAMLVNGSWVTNAMFSAKGIETGLAPTPVGPTGKNASMYNGLADSIWVGTDNKPLSAKWVEFLGSPECQNIVGEAAVVFPAIPSGTKIAEAAWKAKGIDLEPFTSHLENKTTFLFPITDHASQIEGIMQPAMDAVLTGQADPSSFTEANNQVNALFG